MRNRRAWTFRLAAQPPKPHEYGLPGPFQAPVRCGVRALYYLPPKTAFNCPRGFFRLIFPIPWKVPLDKKPNGFIFGVPGSGKSFFAKMEMGNVFLNTDDDIIVIDPQHEYFGIAERFGGQVVVLSTYTGTTLTLWHCRKTYLTFRASLRKKGSSCLASVSSAWVRHLIPGRNLL